MKNYHFVGLAVIVLLAYFVGVQWPSFGQSAIAKVSGAVAS